MSSNLQESWAVTTAHLVRAAGFTQGHDLTNFREDLDHNELELAADDLNEIGEADEQLPGAFWEALQSAYQNMDVLQHMVTHCGLRKYEAEHGFVEARLTLRPTKAGGRANPIFTGYRPDWNLGNRSESGAADINGAPISIEDCQSLEPGTSGTVRLHPIWQEAWRGVRVGAELDMHEGPQVVGSAVVLRVTLRTE